MLLLTRHALLISFVSCAASLKTTSHTRRATISAAVATTTTTSALSALPASSSSVEVLVCGGDAACQARIAEDMKRRAEEIRKDVAYPPAILGVWQCTWELRRVEGSTADAESAWRALGGRGTLREPERFLTRFVPIPDARRKAGVSDRAYEYAQRSGLPLGSIEWSREQPDILRVVTEASVLMLTTVRREVDPYSKEPPYGLKFREVVLYLAGGDAAPRVLSLTRRLAPTGDGSISGMETVETFSSRSDAEGDGTAKPTSTTTSRIRFTRVLSRSESPGQPSPAKAAAARAAVRMMAVGDENDEGEDATKDAAGDEDIEAARSALENLVRVERGAPAADDAADAGSTGMRTTSRPASSFRFDETSSPGLDARPAVDDIAAGLGEVSDVATRSLGILGLGIEISLGGLFSPFGLASIVIFALLVNTGEFGSTSERFVAEAPNASAGDYYRPREGEAGMWTLMAPPAGDEVEESEPLGLAPGDAPSATASRSGERR